MKINFIKMAGGTLAPADDYESERMQRFKTGCMYEIDIKLSRNPKFHGKVFAFFNFCFNHWRCDKEFLSEKDQFDYFRKKLTILSGFYREVYDIDGSVELIALSLKYENMEQEEFERCYHALVNAALKHIFHTTDENTYNQLLSFF